MVHLLVASMLLREQTALGIALQIAGNWTSTIGFAFFFYGEHRGLLGAEDLVPGTDMAEAGAEAIGQLVVYLTQHIAIAVVVSHTSPWKPQYISCSPVYL